MDVTPFGRAVARQVRRIPAGRVATYGDVAEAVGRPGAARAVGTLMRSADGGRGFPYHRVVGADGHVGGAGRRGGGDTGVRQRARSLRREGVRVAAHGRIVDFARLRVRWP